MKKNINEIIKGIAASEGYGIGRVVIKKELSEPVKELCSSIELELKVLSSAFDAAENDLECEYTMKVKELGEKHGEIFKAHIAMLNDPELKTGMEAMITENSYVAPYAVKLIIDKYVAIFEGMDNEYFRERALDVKDIGTRLLKKLLNIEDTNLEGNNLIIVAKDLTPSDTAKIDKAKVEGFITAIGGSTSHSAIIARTLGIPAVMGIKNINEKLNDGEYVIIDGFTGEIHIAPDEATIDIYIKKKAEYEENQKKLQKYRDMPSKTACGHHIEIGANIASPEDVKAALFNGAEGVGLFRSEFLYMNKTKAPDEEEQYMAYKAVLEGMGRRPVVIRTLDVGGDKHIPYLNIPEEMNPFLGYRAIRYCLDDKDLFKTQLRALMRASVYGNLKIMFPMISSLEEIRASKAILEEVKSELLEKKIDFDKSVEVGIMIEIPAAAIISDVLAREVDFFSIGTNDLIQYTIAVDRMNENIKELYNQYHPAVLRLIQTTIKNGIDAGIWVGMCGSVAGDALLFPMLIAMGLQEFSMSPNQILNARKTALDYSLLELKQILNGMMALSTSYEVEEYLKSSLVGKG